MLSILNYYAELPFYTSKLVLCSNASSLPFVVGAGLDQRRILFNYYQ